MLTFGVEKLILVIGNMLPFIENKISEEEVIREFNQETDSEEFMWHRDQENRIVEALAPSDWRLQLEDSLPVRLDEKIEIPAGAWHRVIKGRGNLLVKITKKK